ncbi:MULTISPECIES: PaaI family thioesterase [unclassified Roseitalea]|uniref:PaaI family thioesterase n=1 Tax=unclassified Roseitalea TaxID=2639107 RepID=UPI00273EDC66|nr:MULTISPECIES: PaaI family thioesterase [unclassified Roseitalea]
MPDFAMADFAHAMPFARLLGLEVTDATPEKVVGTITVRGGLCTIGDSAHGGTLMAFADCLAAIGAHLNRPEGAAGTITIESKTNFLGRAASGTRLSGTALPVSVGRRVSVWQARIEDEAARVIAVSVQTQLVL